jgi:hypothetical protein
MNNFRRLPSYIVPISEIVLEKLNIKPADPVTVNDDWQREHYSGSIIIEEDGHNGLIDNWVYFHALLADSRLPIYALHAKGEELSSFQIDEFDDKGNPKLKPRIINFDPVDVLPATYLEHEEVPEISYEQAYKRYLDKDEIFLSAVKNYFVAQDINHHKRLRYINSSYWQIVMLVSTLEALLPPPIFCKGKCETCKKGINHVLNDLGKDWNELLFDKIADKKIRSQYRRILDEVRWKIRNDTVHNGLAPGNSMWHSDPLPDGKTEFTTEKSLSGYTSDGHSLESLIEQLRQIGRYTLLDKILGSNVFPPLKGLEVNSFSVKVTESPTTIKLDID